MIELKKYIKVVRKCIKMFLSGVLTRSKVEEGGELLSVKAQNCQEPLWLKVDLMYK